MDGRTDIDIVVVNYRSAAHTVNCVQAAHDVAARDGVSVRVIVVNNSSGEESLERDLQSAGGADLLNNSRNVGFSAACNQGAASGSAEFIFFLNPDATLKTGAFR